MESAASYRVPVFATGWEVLRSGDLMPSLISLGKTAGDRCFGNSSLVSAAVMGAAASVTARAVYKIVRRYGGLLQII